MASALTEIVAGRVETGLHRGVLGAGAQAALYAGGAAVQPESVAEMVVARLGLPAAASVTRFAVAPTRPTGPSDKKGGPRT